MSEQESGKQIPSDDRVAVELRAAVRTGDVAAIQGLLRSDPALVSARLVSKDGGSGTPLHLVTDWPGYFPKGPEIVRLMIDSGADPNALTAGRDSPGPGDETPLHYAASSDDVDVAEALIDGGADIEVPDGSIGTPLDNAVGYGCWHVARLLVTRGARVDKAWHAAPKGRLTGSKDPRAAARVCGRVAVASGHACAGGQRAGLLRFCWPAGRRSQLGAGLRARDTAGRRQRAEYHAGERPLLAAGAGATPAPIDARHRLDARPGLTRGAQPVEGAGALSGFHQQVIPLRNAERAPRCGPVVSNGGVRVAQLLEQVRAHGIKAVMASEPLVQRLEQAQTGRRAFDHGRGDGKVQGHHRIASQAFEDGVEGEDLRPSRCRRQVRRLVVCSAAMAAWIW